MLHLFLLYRVVILTRMTLKYCIGPKIQKWTELSPHEIYIRKILMANTSLLDKKSNTKFINETKNNVSLSCFERRAKIFKICQKEMPKNQLLQDSNKLHG